MCKRIKRFTETPKSRFEVDNPSTKRWQSIQNYCTEHNLLRTEFLGAGHIPE